MGSSLVVVLVHLVVSWFGVRCGLASVRRMPQAVRTTSDLFDHKGETLLQRYDGDVKKAKNVTSFSQQWPFFYVFVPSSGVSVSQYCNTFDDEIHG